MKANYNNYIKINKEILGKIIELNLNDTTINKDAVNVLDLVMAHYKDFDWNNLYIEIVANDNLVRTELGKTIVNLGALLKV